MKPTDNLSSKNTGNPYHSNAPELPFEAGDGAALSGLRHEVEDVVKLELTAEEMLGEEVDLAKAYLEEDAHGIWADMKLGLYEWELITSDWLLRAADPTRVDWQLNHWWGDDEAHLH